MPVGRVCEIKDCTTILSRYNRQRICWPCHAVTPMSQLPYTVTDWLRD